MGKLYAYGAVALLVLAFQNCGRARFDGSSASNGSVAQGQGT